MARVLVTGGAGFIGSHVAEALLVRGDEVTALDHFNDFYDPAIKRRNVAEIEGKGAFDLVEADIRDRDRMRRLFDEKRFDVVVHLAAMAGVRPSIKDPELYVSVNLIGSTILMDEAVRTGVKKFVFASSSSVYGNNKSVPFSESDPVDHPISPYAATKKAQEVLSHTYHHLHGLPMTGLRFFTVYGPRQRPEMAIHRFTRLVDEGQPIPFFGDGSSRRDYTYVDDITDGVIRAVDHCDGWRIYNLGESRTTTLSRLVEIVGEVLGKEVIIDRQPFQPGDVQETYADVSLAREELGYDPHTTVEDGIERFVRWYRSVQS